MITERQLNDFIREYARCGICGGRIGGEATDQFLIVLPFAAGWVRPVFQGWPSLRQSAIGAICHTCSFIEHARWEVNEAIELLGGLPDDMPTDVLYHDICDLEDL